MADIAELGIRIRSDEAVSAERALNRFADAADKAEGSTQKLERQVGRVRGAFAAAAGAFGVALGGGAFVAAATSALSRLSAIEVSTRKIDTALRLNGYTWDLTTKKVLDFADALERRTGRAMQEVLDITPNLASFGFTEEVAMRSIALADDMAAAWGGSLQQNFEGLARALADPIKGFAMLSARGIQLDADQKKLVKSLMETNRGLEAQKIVFEALESQVKGVAEAGYTPLQRAQDAARKSVEGFFERLVSAKGAGDAMIATLNGITTAMNYLGENIGIVATALGVFAAAHIVSGIASVVLGITSLTGAMNIATVAARALSVAMAFVGGPIGAAVIALAGAYLLLRNNVTEAQRAAQDANDAYGSNAKAMAAAERSSSTYTQALRDQIAMQIEVARTAVTMAEAAYESALATRNAFIAITGFKFAPLEYNADKALGEVNALDLALGKLEDQLKKVDSNLGKPAALPDRQFGSEATKPKGKTAAEKAAEAYKRITRDAQQYIAMQELEQQAVGMTERAANALRYEQDLLNQAQNANIKVTPAQTTELKALAAAMADAEAETTALQRAFDFAKDVTKGFISDFKSGLEEGKGFFRSFGEAGLNALNKIADKLIDMAIDNLWMNAFGGASGAASSGGGGVFGSLFSGLGKLFGFSSGGWTGNGPTGAVAGAVHGQEFVVRAGPAAQNRQMLEAMNAGRPVAANSNGGQKSEIEVSVSVNDDGKLVAVARQAAGDEANVRIKQYEAGSFNRHLANNASAKKRVKGF